MPDIHPICWSCGVSRAPTDALCPACGKVQPPTPPQGVLDKFAVLGLPRAYELDERALEETFRALSRKLHPDRFVRATPRERRFSLEQTTLLNDAYRTLRDPVRRAEHLLALRGVKVAGEERSKEACATASVGIDLGTTNSLVAVVRPDPETGAGKPRALPVDEGSTLLPSVVSYTGDRTPIVGRAARRLAAEAPRETIVSVKRFMGKTSADPETRRLSPYQFAEGESGTVRFEVRGRAVTPVEVSAEILRALKARAEEQLGMEARQAVITVPAYFDDAQRQATKEAGRLAGLEVLRLLNEPTAAALAYGLDKRSQGTFAVYDLGGGTFDISILKLVEGVFEVKAVGGDSALGGDDFDRAIAERLLVEMGRTRDPRLVREAIDAAKAAKEALTRSDRVEVEIDGWTRMLTRAQMEEIIRPLFERTGPSSRRALKDAGV